MATYPIKMLRDEDRQPFVPFTNAAAVVDSNNVTLQELMTNGKYKIQNNVTTSSAGKGVLDAYQGKVLNDKFNNYVPLSQKGVANGVATLGADAKVPSSQLPSYVDDVIEAYIRSGATALSSTWLSLTDGGAALTPEKGKIYLIMTAGSYQNKQYRWGGSTYVLCNPSDVNSVNGFTGVVVLKELTIQKNGTQVGDKFNGSANKTINITVPTKTSDITNNSGFITAADDITGNAATATNATNDASGNNIENTYVKKAGDTMTGRLIVSSGDLSISSGYLRGDASTGTNHVIKLGHANDNTLDFYEYGGVFRFYKSVSGTNTLLGTVNSNGWEGNVKGNLTGNVTGNVTGLINGNDVQGPVYGTISITKSLTVGTDWMDTGIVGSDLQNSGSFIVQLSGAQNGQGGLWGEIFTGVTSNYASGTNSGESDEILLQNTGHAPNSGDLFLRWVRTSKTAEGNLKLQIASAKAFTAAQNMVFKFKRLI